SDDERHRDRSRRLPLVRRRSAARRSHPGLVGLCAALRRDRSARREGALFARSRSHTASDEVSLQLRDLLRRLRCPAALGEGADLSADVAGALWRGTWRPVSRRTLPGGSARHCRNPERHEARPARVFPERESITTLTTSSRAFSVSRSPVFL